MFILPPHTIIYPQLYVIHYRHTYTVHKHNNIDNPHFTHLINNFYFFIFLNLNTSHTIFIFHTEHFLNILLQFFNFSRHLSNDAVRTLLLTIDACSVYLPRLFLFFVIPKSFLVSTFFDFIYFDILSRIFFFISNFLFLFSSPFILPHACFHSQRLPMCCFIKGDSSHRPILSI